MAGDRGAEADFDEPVDRADGTAREPDRTLLEQCLEFGREGGEFLGDLFTLFLSPGGRALPEGDAFELRQTDRGARAHLEQRAGGEGLNRYDASPALDGNRAKLTAVPAGVGRIGRGGQETEGQHGGGLGGTTAEEAQ